MLSERRGNLSVILQPKNVIARLDRAIQKLNLLRFYEVWGMVVPYKKSQATK